MCCPDGAVTAGRAAGRPRGGDLALRGVVSAVFHGTYSFLRVLVNKGLHSAYRFPSPVFLGIGQMAATILILYVSKLNKIIHFPDFEKSIPMKLFPLPLIYVGNHLSGLSSISKLSLSMFTVLRKFTIPLTLLLEVILGELNPLNIFISIFAIVLGAFIAAGSDLSFNLEGYTFVLLNDIFTVANGVYTKQKMDPKATHFQEWTDFLFVFLFLLSSFLGHYNSALTTAVVGAIKKLQPVLVKRCTFTTIHQNISIAYIKMLVGGDYVFSVLNFIGLSICMVGGLRYSFLSSRENSKPAQPENEKNVLSE